MINHQKTIHEYSELKLARKSTYFWEKTFCVKLSVLLCACHLCPLIVSIDRIKHNSSFLTDQKEIKVSNNFIKGKCLKKVIDILANRYKKLKQGSALDQAIKNNQKKVAIKYVFESSFANLKTCLLKAHVFKKKRNQIKVLPTVPCRLNSGKIPVICGIQRCLAKTEQTVVSFGSRR